MMDSVRTDQIDRARARLRDLARSAPDSSGYRRGVLEVVETLVPWDGAVFVEFDPASHLATAATCVDLDADQCATAFDIELGARDGDGYEQMASAGTAVATLSRRLGDQRGHSARYRELYQPFGLHDELRAVAQSAGSCWGGLSLAREPGRDFTDDDAAAIGAIQDVIAEGLRAMLVRGAVAQPPPAGPAVIILGPDGTVESGTDQALALLARPDPRQSEPAAFAPAVHAVAARVRASSTGIARARLRGADGTWHVLHAAPLRTDGPGRVVVTIEPARPPEIVTIVAAVIGLSLRETEVLEHLLARRSSVEIARKLFLSPHTVNDHVRHIFEKTGVHTRQELMTWLFFSHYVDRLSTGPS